MNSYTKQQNVRSILGIIMTLSLIAWSYWAFKAEPPFPLFAIFTSCISIYSIIITIQGGLYSLDIHDDNLIFIQTCFPKTKKIVSLRDVSVVEIQEGSGKAYFRLKGGTKTSVQIVGSCREFEKFFKKNYPEITTEYYEDIS